MKLIIDIDEELYTKLPYLINKGSVLIRDILDAVEKATPLDAQPIHGSTYGGVSWGGTYKEEAQPNSNEFFNFDAPMVKKSDAVSREAVIDHICEDKECYKEECKGRTLKRCPDLQWVFELPPVTPQRPKGKWIKCKSRFEVTYFKCSECGRKLNWIDRDDNYCNSCGSDNSESTKELFKEWDTKIAEMSGGGEDEI